jgi:hypothetical protein
VTQATLARRYGVSERTVRRAIRRVQREDPAAHERRVDYHRFLDTTIEQLAVERMNARSPRTRIAAMRQQMNLMKERERFHLDPGIRFAPPERDQPSPDRFAVALVALAIAEGLDEGVVAWIQETSEKLLAGGT